MKIPIFAKNREVIMGVFNNLFSRIAISSNHKITVQNINKGIVKVLSCTVNEDENSTSITLHVSVDSEKINFIIDNKPVNKVSFLFDIILNNCSYNENEEWEWEEESGYEIIAGKKTPNIIVFSDNKAINGGETGTDYVAGLSKQEDESLGYQNPLIMIAKTPLKNRVEAFKEVLKTASKVQEVESI